MKRLLTTLVILTGLFAPSLAVAAFMKPVPEGVKYLKFDDLVERGGLYYKKFTEEPFTGKTTVPYQSTFHRGKLEGPMIWYHANGQLWWKGTWKDGMREGPWVFYYKGGTKDTKGKGSKKHEGTGTYRKGKKVSD